MKLRFSIRDLLWLTLAVALVIGWWLDRSRLAGNEKKAAAYDRIRQFFRENPPPSFNDWQNEVSAGRPPPTIPVPPEFR
jgi:hypothetical protein